MADLSRFSDKELQNIIQGGKQRLSELELTKISEAGEFGRFLPGLAKTEQLIAGRKPALETFKEETALPFRGGFGARALKAGVTGLKALDIPRERLEAAIANPLLFTQRGLTREERVRPTGVVESLGITPALRLGKEAISGLTGERRAQLGDIPRAAGFPEPLSAAIGLGSTIGIIDIPAQKVISRALSKVGRGIKGAIVGDRRAIFDGVKKFVIGIDDVLDEAGKNVGKLFEGAVGRKPVDIGVVNKVLRDLPETIRRKILSRDAKVLFGIRRTTKGGLVPTKNNIWKVRKFLDDFITPREFQEGATRVHKQAISRARGLLKGILESGDEVAVRPVLAEFSDIIDNWGFVKTSLTMKGRPVVNKFLKVLQGSGELETQDTLRALAGLVPRAQKVINQAVRFNRAQAVRKFAGGAALVGGAGYFLRRQIADLFSGLGGGGGIQSSGGQ